MLLALNIGNSTIDFCVFENADICLSAALSSDTARTADEYAILFMQTFSMRQFDPGCIDAVIVSSVVPVLNDTVRAAIARFSAAPLAFVGAGMKTGLRIRIDTPAQLGADLVALACASKHYTGGACIIASFDTATTLTVLDTVGDVVGAVIMPGVSSSAQALKRDTAQLTEISLSGTPLRHIIGKNTAEALRAGLLFGCAAQIDGMVSRICEELDCPTDAVTLLATGKDAPHIIPHCKHTFLTPPHLLFSGLYMLSQRNRPL